MEDELNNRRKKYFQLDNILHDDVFALLESVDRDPEDDIDELMNDSNTEFVADDDFIENDVASVTDHSITKPSANTHRTPARENQKDYMSHIDFTLNHSIN